MLDRVPTKPNRYAVYDDNHNFIRYEYHERADEPTQTGDAINKANLLPDAVATALGLTGNPQVADALAKLSNSVSTLQYVWDKLIPTFPFNPTVYSRTVLRGNDKNKLWVVTYGDSISYDGERITIDNPTTINISYNNASSFSTVLQGKYWFSDYSPTLYKGTSTGSLTQNNYNNESYYIEMESYNVSVEFSFVQQVSAWEPNAYPSNGFVDGYKYIARGHPQPIDARIATGSYTGTGTYGSSNKNTLTFPFEPKLVIIKSKDRTTSSSYSTIGLFVYNSQHGISALGITDGTADAIRVIYATWNNNSLTWYSTINADYQLNATYSNGGTTYYCEYEYVALG